jgi:hypothetical protein
MIPPNTTAPEREALSSRVNALTDPECRDALQFLAGLDPWMANVALNAVQCLRHAHDAAAEPG